jgi:hypothetical protein
MVRDFTGTASQPQQHMPTFDITTKAEHQKRQGQNQHQHLRVQFCSAVSTNNRLFHLPP